MTIPKKHRALSSGALAPGARFPTHKEARAQRLRCYFAATPATLYFVSGTLAHEHIRGFARLVLP